MYDSRPGSISFLYQACLGWRVILSQAALRSPWCDDQLSSAILFRCFTNHVINNRLRKWFRTSRPRNSIVCSGNHAERALETLYRDIVLAIKAGIDSRCCRRSSRYREKYFSAHVIIDDLWKWWRYKEWRWPATAFLRAWNGLYSRHRAPSRPFAW